MGAPIIHAAFLEDHTVPSHKVPLSVMPHADALETLQQDAGFKLKGHRVDFSLMPEPDEWVALKHTYSGFTRSVEEFFIANSIDTPIICGVWEGTNPQDAACCVSATALATAKAGLHPIIASGATNLRVTKDGRAPDSIAILNQKKGIRLMPWRETIEMVAGGAAPSRLTA